MKSGRWSKARAWGQLFFWLSFIVILINTRDPIENSFIYNLLPKLSIHLGIVSSIAGRKIIDSLYISVILLFLTFVLGRFFCGWVCPLGITLDITDRIFNRKKKNHIAKQGGKINIKPYKYLVFFFSVVLSIAGIHIAGIIDPLSLSFRTYGTVLYPYFDTTAKLFFNGLYQIPGVNLVSEPVYALLNKRVLDYRNIMFLGHLTVFTFFFVIIVLSFFARRFWCQSLCPLGAVLALTAKINIFQREADEGKCTSCLACEKECRMNAISGKGLETLHGECVKCFECLKSCKYDAIEFKFRFPILSTRDIVKPEEKARLKRPEDFDFSRRGILYGALSSLMIIPVFKINPEYKNEHLDLIRPPGALAEDKFLSNCIRCGECMKICPTNALHPTIMEAGLEGIFTPRLVPRLGYCEKNCILCSKICPTNALKKIKVEDKETTIIGTAYFVKDQCIPWSEGINCLVCEEMCPTKTKAIQFNNGKMLNKKGEMVEVMLPYVIEKLCIGCGVCETKCPVPGRGAIRVAAPKLFSGVNRF